MKNYNTSFKDDRAKSQPSDREIKKQDMNYMLKHPEEAYYRYTPESEIGISLNLFVILN
jgi:hypothetical protein